MQTSPYNTLPFHMFKVCFPTHPQRQTKTIQSTVLNIVIRCESPIIMMINWQGAIMVIVSTIFTAKHMVEHATVNHDGRLVKHQSQPSRMTLHGPIQVFSFTHCDQCCSGGDQTWPRHISGITAMVYASVFFWVHFIFVLLFSSLYFYCLMCRTTNVN